MFGAILYGGSYFGGFSPNFSPAVSIPGFVTATITRINHATGGLVLVNHAVGKVSRL